MSDLSEALCRGKSHLFDSTHVADHRVAREICRECPAIIACHRLLLESQQVSRTIKAAGGGPVGTWAGQLLGKNSVMKRLAECGTEQGYQAHRQWDDETCAECRAAHAAHWRETQARRKAS